MERIAFAWCSDGMRRLLLVVVAALVLPAAAQAKELTALAVCGPGDCRDVDVSGFGHDAPFASDTNGPAPGPYHRLDVEVDGQSSAWGLFYDPGTGLVAREDRPGTWVWSRLAPSLAESVKDTAKRVQPFPAPRVSGARVGSKRVSGSTYAALIRADGPFVVPQTSEDAVAVTLIANRPNPWTQVTLLWYPEDSVLFRSPGTFVRLADAVAADIDAARPLGSGPEGGTHVPWIPIGVAAAGLLILLVLARRRASSREVAPVH
jgi:hypothetical protein